MKTQTTLRRLCAKALVTMALSMPLTAAAQQQILGKWWSPKKDGHVEIFQDGDRYHGKIVWGTQPRKDTKNPKPELRNRDLMGVVLFSNFRYDSSDKEWVDGSIYDPDSGKTYDCKMWVSKDGSILNVRGFVGVSMFGRTEKFERVR